MIGADTCPAFARERPKNFLKAVLVSGQIVFQLPPCSTEKGSCVAHGEARISSQDCIHQSFAATRGGSTCARTRRAERRPPARQHLAAVLGNLRILWRSTGRARLTRNEAAGFDQAHAGTYCGTSATRSDLPLKDARRIPGVVRHCSMRIRALSRSTSSDPGQEASRG